MSEKPSDAALAAVRTLAPQGDGATAERRRSGSETRQRQAAKLTRFSPDELAQIEAAAERYGVTFSGFVRAAALSAADGKGLATLPVRSVRRKPVDKELMARLLGQLGKVGSNLNQIVKLAYGGLDRAQRAEAAGILAELRDMVPLIHEALGRRPE